MFVHVVSKSNWVYDTHTNPWILFIFIMIQFGLYRFQVFLLGRQYIFLIDLHVTFGSVVSSFGKWVFLREISISLKNDGREASSCFSFIVYFGGFSWFDKISRQVKWGRWSDMLLISTPEYNLEVFSDNLQKVWSVTEPVFFVKRHGCTILG